ncbi:MULTISPECIES: zinc ribbon domain-containing protein, partial [unclassified Micromonospora]|uniref:zinc ribbon domain-containing protein n=1 Tax=unclassified Micromonospora TaxID=2617518 RepID=UPI003A89B223
MDRWLPSTRMCSDCGRINEKMALNVRSWVCPCGGHHDRDVNAAINIKAAGQADFNDRGARVGPRPVPAPRGETVTHQNAARVTR